MKDRRTFNFTEKSENHELKALEKVGRTGNVTFWSPSSPLTWSPHAHRNWSCLSFLPPLYTACDLNCSTFLHSTSSYHHDIRNRRRAALSLWSGCLQRIVVCISSIHQFSSSSCRPISWSLCQSPRHIEQQSKRRRVSICCSAVSSWRHHTCFRCS